MPNAITPTPSGRAAGGDTPDPPWRPPARASRAAHTRQLFVAIAVALAVAGWVLYSFARFTHREPEKVNLGGRTFVLRDAARRAEQAAVGPLFFNDLVRDNRPLPLVLSSLGKNDWAALNAIPAGSPERCAVGWDPARRVFVDPCNEHVFAPDGTSDSGPALTRYAATVNGRDQLVVDLNASWVRP